MSENLRLVWDEKQPGRIDPEVKEKWLKALRSGEYPQTEGALQRTVDSRYGHKGYCCLGVLADQLVDDEEKVVWRFSSSANPILAVWSDAKEDYEEEDSLLPEVLAEQLGMTVEGYVTRYNVWNHDRHVGSEYIALTGLNDEGFTFAQIADVIDYFL